jgi:hypothetical protein
MIMNAMFDHIIGQIERHLQEQQAQQPCVHSGAACASEDG